MSLARFMTLQLNLAMPNQGVQSVVSLIVQNVSR